MCGRVRHADPPRRRGVHAQDGGQFATSPAEWNWKLLIRTPDFIATKDLAKAVATLKAKGKAGPLADVKIEKIKEGRCVQVLHHEIYLSDPRRVAPERLRTILRHPVRRAA